MNAKIIMTLVLVSLSVGVGMQLYNQHRDVAQQACHVTSEMPTTAPCLNMANPPVAESIIDSACVPAEGSTPSKPVAQATNDPDSSHADKVTIQARGIAMLPAALQNRFPAARTIVPVEIDSLADQLVKRREAGVMSDLMDLGIPTPDNRMLDMVVKHHMARSLTRGTITGVVQGFPQSRVIVSYCDEVTTASVIIPGQTHIEIAYAGNGTHVLLDIDPEKILPNAPPVIPPIQVAVIKIP